MGKFAYPVSPQDRSDQVSQVVVQRGYDLDTDTQITSHSYNHSQGHCLVAWSEDRVHNSRAADPTAAPDLSRRAAQYGDHDKKRTSPNKVKW